jgi:hypothetical protein
LVLFFKVEKGFTCCLVAFNDRLLLNFLLQISHPITVTQSLNAEMDNDTAAKVSGLFATETAG